MDRRIFLPEGIKIKSSPTQVWPQPGEIRFRPVTSLRWTLGFAENGDPRGVKDPHPSRFPRG
jgi:hypothetical protein